MVVRFFGKKEQAGGGIGEKKEQVKDRRGQKRSKLVYRSGVKKRDERRGGEAKEGLNLRI